MGDFFINCPQVKLGDAPSLSDLRIQERQLGFKLSLQSEPTHCLDKFNIGEHIPDDQDGIPSLQIEKDEDLIVDMGTKS